MQSALSLFWMVTGLSTVLGAVFMIIGLVRAPEGHEGPNGFQYARSKTDTPATTHGASRLELA